ncbi:MAG: SIS domain-containing protein [Candidatus Helarchaeota archaeon]
MLNIKVPINRSEFNLSFNVFNNTWQYLIEQIRKNLSYVFEKQSTTLKNFLEFLILNYYPKYNNKNKILFATVGRSLFMGGKTAAMRLSQLGFNVDFPYSSKEISGPGGPKSKIENNDIVIAISTSGRTSYVVNKVNYSRSIGCEIVAATANEKSPLTEGKTKFIIKIPEKLDEKEIIKNNGLGTVFTPLGTTSECTQMVFWEIIGAGLNFLISKIENGQTLHDKDYNNAINHIKSVYEDLLNNAKKDLNNCVIQHNDEIKAFIANLILFYYSNHTVHLYGRGKIFNVVITPFEMRLRQMPHGYITSILRYAPKNRPVRRGQIAILVSGSGGIATTAKKVKELSDNGCIIFGISSVPIDHEFWTYVDNKIRLEGRQKVRDGTWEEKQWVGQHADFAPEGFQFELNCCLLFESIYASICNYIGITEEELKEGHANYE